MPVEFKDYYKTLGVPRTATDDELRKAFRKLAREYHPDVAKNKATAEEKFKEINEAYEVLGDPEKRKKYDTLGQNWNQPGGFRPPPGGQQTRRSRGQAPGENVHFEFGGTGFSDFFEQFFAGNASRFGGARGRSPYEEDETTAVRGSDIEGDILVTLHEALNGSVRSISLRRPNQNTGEEETHTFRVKIPAGVHEGRLIRIPGKGEEGHHGGPAGDLYLHVKFAKHPDFRVRDSDLFYDLEVAPWEAVLGATVKVPTLEGSVSMKIPPGTNSGQQLRLRGKGLPDSEGNRGDLHTLVNIVVPTQITDAQRKLWEQLAELSATHPERST